jgi:hypothetical protein
MLNNMNVSLGFTEKWWLMLYLSFSNIHLTSLPNCNFLYQAFGKGFISGFRLHVLRLRYSNLGGGILLRICQNFKLNLLLFNFYNE